MWSRFLALLLVLAIVPATGEVIELAVHLAQHGDVAHDAGDTHDGAPLGADEHGCSGLFHMCGCHTAPAMTPPPSVATAIVPPVRRIAVVPPAARDGRGAPAPSFRPPIV